MESQRKNFLCEKFICTINNSRRVGDIMTIGKEQRIQCMPIAAVEFLKGHDLLDDITNNQEGGTNLSTFNSLLLDSESEKGLEVHPCFNTRDSFEGKSLTLNEGWYCSVARYLLWKHGQLTVSEEEKEEYGEVYGNSFIFKGPYSHGADVFYLFSGCRLVKFQKNGKRIESIANSFLHSSVSVLHGLSGKVMGEVDRNKRIAPVFEQAYLNAVENYMAIVPRLLTLLAREPQWNVIELDQFIRGKDIHNIEIFEGVLSKEYRQLEKEVGDGLKNISVEYVKKVEDIVCLYADVYGAIREYLEDKVKYE